MQPILGNLAALAVAMIFYLWRAHVQGRQLRRQRILRERVAYMLWVMADRVDRCKHPLSIN
jgi:hypothetical protein